MNNDAMTTDHMREADAMLRRNLTEAFSNLPLIPDAIIQGVHSSGYTETGDFLLMLDCADGGMMFIAVTPGEPVRIVVPPHPQ